MICRLRRHEPSFSSMNERSFESRRVRTQPWTWIGAIGAALCSAAFTEVVAGIVGSLLVNCNSTSSSGVATALWALRGCLESQAGGPDGPQGRGYKQQGNMTNYIC